MFWPTGKQAGSLLGTNKLCPPPPDYVINRRGYNYNMSDYCNNIIIATECFMEIVADADADAAAAEIS